jgi:fructokinase
MERRNMSDVLTMGELLAEFMAERVGQTFLEPGAFLGPFPSGAPAIFADQVAKTGTSAAFIGYVGADGFGDLIVNRLRRDGVDVTGISRTERLPTGTAFVTYRKDGGREFIFNLSNSASSLIDADSVNSTLVYGCRYFHVMGTSLSSAGSIAAVKQAIELVKEMGGKVSFDPNIRPEILSLTAIREAIAFVLSKCDILLPSEADLRYFCGEMPEEESVSKLLSTHRVEMVIVKNAARGCSYYDRSQSMHVRSFRVKEVDPTGAGDCFGGTLISCLAQGVELELALTLANAAGALAVTRRGPMEGNATLTELNQFIASAEKTQ